MRKIILAAVLAIALASPRAALATFPGENGRIAYSFWDGTIHTALASGRGDRAVGVGVEPAWSADGTHIAFERYTSSVQADIFTMRADGSSVRRLTYTPQVSEVSPAYSPGGGRIVYSRATAGDTDLYLMRSRDGGGIRKLAADGLWATWAPDGDRIAFTKYVEGGGIWTVRPDGSRPRRLTNPPGTRLDLLPDYRPDGARIVFYRGAYQQRGTWTIGPDGSDLHQTRACGAGLSYSPDGRQAVSVAGGGKGDESTAVMRGSFSRQTDACGPFHLVADGADAPDWQPLP